MMTSSSSGVVETVLEENNETFSQPLYAPYDNIIMISVKDFNLGCPYGMEVYTSGHNNSGVLLLKRCEHRYTDTYLLDASNVTLRWRKHPKRCDVWLASHRGLVCAKMYVSFHPRSKTPQRLSSGLFNCSVDYYWTFKQHLDCNLKVECEDGRDETGHCPFSSPACHGWVALRNKCYKYFSADTIERSAEEKQSPYTKSARFCSSLNARIATFLTNDDFTTLYNVFEERLQVEFLGEHAVVGLSFGALSVPSMYRGRLVGHEKSVIHHQMDVYHWDAPYRGSKECIFLSFSYRKNRTNYNQFTLTPFTCSLHSFYFENNFRHSRKMYGICEVTIESSDANHNEFISFSKALFHFRNENIKNIHFSKCPNRQMVHGFLSCYPHDACGQTSSYPCLFSKNWDNSIHRTDTLMTSFSVFTCTDGVTRLSYTLVCDFRHHCKDWSDETFCQHPPCDAFACGNGQCVSYSKRCDMVSLCLDDSDELECHGRVHIHLGIKNIKSPALVSFDGVGFFLQQKL